MSFAHDRRGTDADAWSEGRRELAELSWSSTGSQGLGGVDTVVVVAAHPDDETLGAAGLIHESHRRGLAVHVVCATAGEASHPRSPTHTADQLRDRRTRELGDAVELLAPGARADLLDLADGQVAGRESDLVTALVDLVGDGRRTLVVAPWRRDGHPDHESAGRAAAAATVRTGARLLEYPVWFWHWGDPHQAPWADMCRLDLPTAAREAKVRGVAAHRTQVEPLSDRPGDEVLLTADLLRHFTGAEEVFVVQEPRDQALDELHRDSVDPWGVDRRWYEERKRVLLLALLPRATFRLGIEVGCSTGALAERLAERCDALAAVDSSAAALEVARQRLGHLPHVVLHHEGVESGWDRVRAGHTDGPDLVVLSEVGYFLSPLAIDRLADHLRDDLAADAVVILCHWVHPVRGWVLDARGVHDRLVDRIGLPVLARYRDRDVEILALGDESSLPDPHA